MTWKHAAAIAVVSLFTLPAVAEAQGVVRGAREGAAVGNRTAGPVGGAVGGVVGGVTGGVVGGVRGVLGVPDRSRTVTVRSKKRPAVRTTAGVRRPSSTGRPPASDPNYTGSVD
jgi:phage tail tape-measure protein